MWRAKFGELNASDDFLRARRVGECDTLKLETEGSMVCYRRAIGKGCVIAVSGEIHDLI
jgi:hypothetical protein